MSKVLVTGANRGLGLEFVRQYLEAGDEVIACCRVPDKASDLQALSQERLRILPLDVASASSRQELTKKLSGEPLDLLINNAGVFGERGHSFGELQQEGYQECLSINSVAPLMLTQELFPNIEAGAERKVVFITSRMGSIGDNSMGAHLAYRASKAALNAAVHSLAIDMGEKVTFLLLHPGWVQTDMGGSEAPLHPPESIAGMRRVIEQVTPSESGCFLSFEGQTIEW